MARVYDRDNASIVDWIVVSPRRLRRAWLKNGVCVSGRAEYVSRCGAFGEMKPVTRFAEPIIMGNTNERRMEKSAIPLSIRRLLILAD